MLREGEMAPFIERRHGEMRRSAEDNAIRGQEGLEVRDEKGPSHDGFGPKSNRDDSPSNGSEDGGDGNGKGGGGKNGSHGGNNNGNGSDDDDPRTPIPDISALSYDPGAFTTPTTSTSSTMSTSTSTQPVSTIVLVSTVTPTVSSTMNPTITSYIPIMTSVGFADGFGDVTSQPRKGVDGNTIPISYVTSFESTLSAGETGTALADQQPTSSAVPSSGGGKHHGKDNDNDNDNQGGLDPNAEHLLISAGSIGAFILVCFICWIGWRMIKKSKRRDGDGDTGLRLIPDRLASKIPFLRQRAWQNLDDETLANIPPPSYREKASIAGAPSVAGFYVQDKRTQQQQLSAGDTSGAAPQMGLMRSDTINSQISYMNNTNTFNANQINAMIMNAGMNTINSGTMSTMNTMNTIASANAAVFTHQAQPSFNSMNAQFGSGNGTMQTMMTVTNPNGTIRSGMLNPFYNQSELARNPSNAYDPARSQLNRASELSSLSSGFGDGDMLIPEEYLLKAPQPPPAASTNMRQSSNLVGRFSWMSRSGTNSRNNNSPRDTIYTQTSEDSPPRFRTVSSWVNQQAGRIKRAQQRADDDDGQQAPPVPQLPGGQPGLPGLNNPLPAEQSFNMMMNDGEEPRRVEDALANKSLAVQYVSSESSSVGTGSVSGSSAGATAS